MATNRPQSPTPIKGRKLIKRNVPLCVSHILAGCSALNHLLSQISKNDFNLHKLIGPHPYSNLFNFLGLINFII